MKSPDSRTAFQSDRDTGFGICYAGMWVKSTQRKRTSTACYSSRGGSTAGITIALSARPRFLKVARTRSSREGTVITIITSKMSNGLSIVQLTASDKITMHATMAAATIATVIKTEHGRRRLGNETGHSILHQYQTSRHVVARASTPGSMRFDHRFHRFAIIVRTEGANAGQTFAEYAKYCTL